MKELIKQKVDLIAECIFEKIQKTDEAESYGLYSGEFGILLFLFYYSRFSKNEKHRLITENYAEQLFNRFLHETKLHTFCNGFSGIMYLFEFLRDNDFIDFDVNEAAPLLDKYLITRMRNDIQQQNYDFMHGALGVGLYFLKKGTNRECIQVLLDFLFQNAEKDADNQIFKWQSVIDHEQNIIGYNLALSHGISSIIIFLSRVINSGMLDSKILEMLSGAINYVLSHKQDVTQFGSFFPNYIPINVKNSFSKSRLAWCYGDLGIGMALWQSGKIVNNLDWKEKGLEVLLQSTKRREYEETLIRDGGICHGSAGVAMIYRRMYLETHCKEFLESFNFSLTKTFQISRFEDGLAGFKTYKKENWECDYSLLTGISGIGLFLLTCLEDDKQMYDEMFLLS